MISVLFAARDSVYKTLPDVDVWDEDRNALKWPGGNPGVFHPPCRLWSKWMHHFSKAPETEKAYALWSVDKVRQFGGVLEHPACSLLWNEASLPKPGTGDQHGFSVAVYQQWFGHKAQKATWLYICGANKLPIIPFCLDEPVARRNPRHPDMQTLSHRERHGTPLEFAKWLVELATCCKPGEGFFG
jgi:hypothetical protein